MATTFYNQATLSYNGISTTSNTVTGEIVAVLEVNKNALSDVYGRDSTLTYVVNLINTGSAPLNTLTLSDNLGAYDYTDTLTLTPLTYIADSLQYYLNGVLQTTPTVTASPSLTVTGINIPVGANATFIYQTQVNEFAPLATDATLVNTVTVSGDTLSTSVTATETVTASQSPILSISKSVTPVSVAENGQLTYTFTIENIGNTAADAATNVVISDVFTPILSSLSANLDGTALTLGTDYTYNTATGEFQTVSGRITVPAATYTQNTETGAWTVTPGSTLLTVTGIV